MGAVSYLEDIEENRLNGLILREFSKFHEHQKQQLRVGTLTEESLQRDIEKLRQQVIEPLEVIRNKIGDQGLDLGNELLKLESDISARSSAMETLLGKLNFDSSERMDVVASPLSRFLGSFSEQYRQLLRVLQVATGVLGAKNRAKLDQIRRTCEDDVRQLKSLSKRLEAREQSIAILYGKIVELQKELDNIRQPGSKGLDATGYDSFDDYAADMKIKRRKP